LREKETADVRASGEQVRAEQGSSGKQHPIASRATVDHGAVGCHDDPLGGVATSAQGGREQHGGPIDG